MFLQIFTLNLVKVSTEISQYWNALIVRKTKYILQKNFNVKTMKKRPLKFMYLPTGGTELLIAGNLGDYDESGNFTGEHEHICQYTGLDTIGEVYEGHILLNDKGEAGTVIWYKAGFYLFCKRKKLGEFFYIPLDAGMLKNKRIIGHILLHPELVDELPEDYGKEV
jgi:hypothetical protein